MKMIKTIKCNDCGLKLSSAYNTTKIMEGTDKIKSVPIKSNHIKPIHIVSYMNNKRVLESDIVLSKNHISKTF